MTRQEQIHSQGFNMFSNMPTEYGKIKVNTKTLDDAILNLGSINKVAPNLISKPVIYQAIMTNDIATMREISDYFYKSSGIYQRICNYAATMYRYDWYVVPEIYDEKSKTEKILTDFHKVLNYLDNSYIAKTCIDIASNVIRYGAYYGYLVDSPKGVMLQELPANYCRTRFNVGGLPAVEFNMKFFDRAFPDTAYRMQVLNLFPDDFKRGYIAYKQGKLGATTGGSKLIESSVLGSFYADSGWWMLDPKKSVKFNLSNGGNSGVDIPLFFNAIPAIIDLDNAQDLDRRKQMQKLLKIIIQKLPMDKNGDLIFDNEEARDLHNNAVQMLKRAIGVDVLTTIADIDSVDMSDKNTTATQDDLAKVERSVYNSFGVSQNLFNTDGNLSLEKSILNDEGSLRTLLHQFEIFFDRVTQERGSQKNKYNFRLYMLETTQYNYKELSKMYKEQTTLGFSKVLPQIALGHSQSSILNTAYFENEVLKLSEIMIPPVTSSTMRMEDLKGKSEQTQVQKKQNNQGNVSEDKSAGRPEKADSEKSEKTIQNRESMN